MRPHISTTTQLTLYEQTTESCHQRQRRRRKELLCHQPHHLLARSTIGHIAVDTDHENSTLKRFHPQAEFVDIDRPREVDRIFALLDHTDLVVVDCRAASTDLFLDYFAEMRVFDFLAQADTTLTLVIPVNHEADSVEQIRILADGLKNRCRYVVVKNQAHSEHFRLRTERKPCTVTE